MQVSKASRNASEGDLTDMLTIVDINSKESCNEMPRSAQETHGTSART